jgi:hypothetical protein
LESTGRGKSGHWGRERRQPARAGDVFGIARRCSQGPRVAAHQSLAERMQSRKSCSRHSPRSSGRRRGCSRSGSSPAVSGQTPPAGAQWWRGLRAAPPSGLFLRQAAVRVARRFHVARHDPSGGARHGRPRGAGALRSSPADRARAGGAEKERLGTGRRLFTDGGAFAKLQLIGEKTTTTASSSRRIEARETESPAERRVFRHDSSSSP